MADDTDIILWHCSSDSDSMRWTLDGDFLKLQADNSFCLTMKRGADDQIGDGSGMVLSSCSWKWDHRFAVDTERGLIRSKQNAKYTVVVRGNKAMDGANLVLGSHSDAAFQFAMEGNQIKTKMDPDLCISVREGKAGDGSDMILWTCGMDKSQPHDRWTVSGDHLLFDPDNHYCASVRGGVVTDGSDVILWRCDDTPEFRFFFHGDHIRYRPDPDFCLSVREGRLGKGSDIILWTCDVPYRKPDEL